MAAKKSSKKAAKKAPAQTTRVKSSSEPKFPYTTKPNSLRKLLQEIPKKPRPPKYDRELLMGWGFRDTNDYTMIRVLKEVGMLNSSNEPTDIYSQFMSLQNGSTAMASRVKDVYRPLFNASHEPWKESSSTLQNLFNIHSGGSEGALQQQIQTFKVLTEFTSFGENDSASISRPPGGEVSTSQAPLNPVSGFSNTAGININIHIHFPENKSRRDYECMIEDIGRYIFGRESRNDRDER